MREETETSTVRLSATNGSPPQSLLPFYFPGPCQPPRVTSPSQPFPVLFSCIIFASLSPPLLFPTARRRRLSSSLTPHNRRRPRMQSLLVIEPHPDRIYYTAAPRRCAVSPIRNTLRKMAHLDSLLPSPSPSPPSPTLDPLCSRYRCSRHLLGHAVPFRASHARISSNPHLQQSSTFAHPRHTRTHIAPKSVRTMFIEQELIASPSVPFDSLLQSVPAMNLSCGSIMNYRK